MDLAAWWYSSHSEGMLLPLAFGEFINRGDSTNYRNIILRNTEREIQYFSVRVQRDMFFYSYGVPSNLGWINVVLYQLVPCFVLFFCQW